MATGVGLAVTSPALAGSAAVTGPWSWFILAGAAVIDSQFLMPRLLGDSRSRSRSPRLLDVPVGSNEAGAPRIWAIGNRVRVPTHILWQSSKVRESTSNQKGSTGIVQRRVFMDALLSVNDRETRELRQLVGNGKLLLWRSRNLVSITTSGMSATVSSGRLVIAMADQAEPTFTDKFQVGDIVKLRGFISTPSINLGTREYYWRVYAITDHTFAQPSTLTLDPLSGQTAYAATGGSEYAPASVERVDDAIVDECAGTINLGTSFGGPFSGARVRRGNRLWLASAVVDFQRVFQVNDIVRVRGLRQSAGAVELYPNDTWRVDAFGALNGGGSVMQLVGPTASNTPESLVNFASGNICTVEFAQANRFAAGFFPANFDPDANFFAGTDTQGEHPLLAADRGTGNIPAYRGVAIQGLDDFEVTQFGNSLPFSMEAVIDVDLGMTWDQAMRAVLERAGVPSEAINVEGVNRDPFLGFYARGAVPTITAMQPLLVAKQIVGQERDGVISLFQIENADVVQVENGEQFTDLGARLDSEGASDNKLAEENGALEDLPTSIGIRHQDPDNAYADGYQQFGLRNPSGVDWQNEREVDLSNLVLSRRQARSLATTLMRRAWVNSTTVKFTLPARYIDLLENDLVTLTTDNGDDVTVRIVQRDIGSNWLVECVGVKEDVDIAIGGSPVQSSAGDDVPQLDAPPLITGVVLDIPAVEDDHAREPGLYLGACANPGGRFSGCTVYESRDGGFSWQQVAFLEQQLPIGTLNEDLGAVGSVDEVAEPGDLALPIDYTNAVDAAMLHEGDGFFNATESRVRDGFNWAAVENTTTGRWEVLGWTVSTADGEGNYTLENLVRGLRGTFQEAATTAPASGRVVALSDIERLGVFRRFPGERQPVSLAYKFVPVGLTLDDVEAIEVDATWRNCRPAPVRTITKTIGSSPFPVTFEIENPTRTNIDPLQPGPYPVDEPEEEYRLTIYDPTGTYAVRTKTITSKGTGSPHLRDKFFTYTPSQQTADGYTPSGTETFWIDVQQVGQFGDSDSVKQEL